MNFIQKTLAGLAIAATSMFPVEAQNVEQMDPHFRDHYNLALAVEQVGIDFLLNPSECFARGNDNVYGWYAAGLKQLVVCQQNAFSSKEVEWTAEDLDTLRHEVHHLVQDCRDGRLQGGLHLVYQDPVSLAKSALSYETIAQILKAYSDLSDYNQMMEIEAFAVAALDDPQEQLRDIQTYCM